jgi:predicted GTPase
MKILKEFLAKMKSRKQQKDIMQISDIIGPMIEKAVWDIFVSYRVELLSEDITFVIPAIWGAKKDGELTSTQKAINEQIAPVINRIFELLDIRDLDASQDFALNYIIRGLIVSKITYMIEAFRSRLKDRTMDEQNLKDALLHFKPLGSA